MKNIKRKFIAILALLAALTFVTMAFTACIRSECHGTYIASISYEKGDEIKKEYYSFTGVQTYKINLKADEEIYVSATTASGDMNVKITLGDEIKAEEKVTDSFEKTVQADKKCAAKIEFAAKNHEGSFIVRHLKK